MTIYVMRGADWDVEPPPLVSETEARRYAQQWANELDAPVILFRDDNGRLRHVDNMQPERRPRQVWLVLGSGAMPGRIVDVCDDIEEADRQGEAIGGLVIAVPVVADYRR